MNIIINNSSMVPIYEQIMDQIKEAIVKGTVSSQDILPSVRVLAKDLKISALTVKKAYDALESDGLIVTVHGKGSFIAETNTNFMIEEQKKEVEADLEMAIQKARRCLMSDDEIKELIELLMEG